jgi:hypothetical protein
MRRVAGGVVPRALGHPPRERRELLDQRVVLAADHAVDLVGARDEATVGRDRDRAVPVIAIVAGDRADDAAGRVVVPRIDSG